MRRTLRREELAKKVCSVPYAAQNWPKKCAAYPTPHRTDPKSVRRTLRRIELAKRVCSVPYAAKNWPKKCAAYPTPHRTGSKSVQRTLRRTLFPCGNFGAITPPAICILRLMVCLPHRGYTLESPGLSALHWPPPGNNTWEKATPLGVVPSPTHNAKAESRHRLRNTDA